LKKRGKRKANKRSYEIGKERAGKKIGEGRDLAKKSTSASLSGQ